MKKYLVYSLLFLVSCTQLALDENKAKATVTDLIETLKDHQFEKTSTYYSDALNESEPVPARTTKFVQIESAAGPILSSECVESAKSTLDERAVYTLKYKVTCKNTVLIQTFVVAMEEGKYKVIRHDISNQVLSK
jgi:hypothetical protein